MENTIENYLKSSRFCRQRRERKSRAGPRYWFWV